NGRILLSRFSLCSCSKFPPRKYYYVDKKMSWNDAQQYCREKYTDLATFENMDDISRLNSTFSYDWKKKYKGLSKKKSPSSGVWIGLYREPWTWSDNSNCLFRNWRSRKPNNADFNDFCVCEYSQHQWTDDDCALKKPFFCNYWLILQNSSHK
uniref:C-type lectin domain-containing protein n=1 Tax=Maylandia zebra TaxID=106582 RepID=A0A3P9CGR9_9CICH